MTPKPFKWTFLTSGEASIFSKGLFDDFFVAAEFVSGGFQNIIKKEDARLGGVQSFLDKYMTIQFCQTKLGVVSGEVGNLCKELFQMCRKGLRRFSRVIAGGFFYNDTTSEDLGKLIYISNTSKEFEKGTTDIILETTFTKYFEALISILLAPIDEMD